MTEKSCKTLETGPTPFPEIRRGDFLILSESQMFLYKNNEWHTYAVPPLPEDLTVKDFVLNSVFEC
jgi:hypothetical protein